MVPSERIPTSSLPRLRRCPPLPVRSGAHASLSLPLSSAIDLHEIHLAPQSSLQVPVGHIPVPGGIKLCSPGTFWIANYLIINNGSCQVNFTKPNTATIRYTNSERGSARMALRHLWAGSPCQSADRSPLRHARMPLRHLWAGSPCQRPVSRTLRHAITCIRWVMPASRVRGSTCLSESSAVRGHRSSSYYPVNQRRLGIMRFFHDPYPWSRFAS